MISLESEPFLPPLDKNSKIQLPCWQIMVIALIIYFLKKTNLSLNSLLEREEWKTSLPYYRMLKANWVLILLKCKHVSPKKTISLIPQPARELETKTYLTLPTICAPLLELNTMTQLPQGITNYFGIINVIRRREVELLGKLRTFVE